MECYILPDGSYYDTNDMLRNKDGILLPDGLYKSGDDTILYEGIFSATMIWGSDEVRAVNEPIFDESLLKKAN